MTDATTDDPGETTDDPGETTDDADEKGDDADEKGDGPSGASGGPTKVAVACQGGGSHTAFTAGVLTGLLEAPDPDFEVTALTGTSGGALCAFLAWYALQTDGPDRAVELLADLWADLEADGVLDAATNAAVVTATAALHAGLPVPQVSPAHVGADEAARERLADAVERHVDRGRVADLVDPPDPRPPRILVSAVDVNDGHFETFTDRPAAGRDGAGTGAAGAAAADADAASADTDAASAGGGGTGATTDDTDRTDADAAADGVDDGARTQAHRIEPPPQPISVEAVLASGAVPTLYEAMRIRDASGRTRAYWDGLLSQNPPVRNLLSGGLQVAEKPDEIWLVRINPRHRSGRLSTLSQIADRRNELAGSLSLYQELHFVRTVNEWLDEGWFEESFADRFKHVTVREIALEESRLDPPRRLLGATKLDRAPRFVRDLQRLGAEQAREFLRNRDDDRYVVVA